MPNLIGTGNNQVPINGMLGGLAYQSPDNAVIKTLELTNLAGHNSVIPSTAVDVFVYDTRKDSDGGAWRKRTQHTSWYNETLNTATRGSRRDFPAVAVIVRESGYLKIYDGDDPDLPMWMVFEANNNTSAPYLLEYFTTGGTSVTALNGIIVSGHNSNGATTINFINEKSIRYRQTASSGTYDVLGFISQRNTFLPVNFSPYNNTIGLVSSAVNDVAMTVLPNAPIDSSTGLPVPTIAVATNGGVSIIKDDGSVYDYTRNANETVSSIDFDSDNKLILANSITQGIYYNVVIPSSDIVNADYNGQVLWPGGIPASLTNGSTAKVISRSSNTLFRGSTNGIHILTNYNLSTNGMVAYATTSYNTGWMHGDAKGAFLSDTSTTSVTGTELITNGTFATNTTGWTAANSASVTLSSNRIRVTVGASINGLAYQQITTVVGQWYTISYDGFPQTANTAFGQLYIRDGSISGTVIIASNNATQTTYSHTFQALSTSTFIVLYGSSTNTNGNYAEWDNISLRIAELDRSVNNKGLQVFGTITKSVVETGSNLVGYTNGSSNSNYLILPLSTSIINLTSNFSVSYWFKCDGTQYNGWSIVENDISSQSGYNKTAINWYVQGGPSMGYRGASITGSSDLPYLANVWNFITITKTSSGIQMFLNGNIISSTSGSCTNPTVPYSLRLFQWSFDNTFFGSANLSMSLFRLSQSVPSLEQILKMYNDEKALFQPNSQCTLFGSSDAVTALAYDDSYSTLLVGTSSGRSDFRGLERINNTTTAVTTAISASNGLIAEQ